QGEESPPPLVAAPDATYTKAPPPPAWQPPPLPPPPPTTWGRAPSPVRSSEARLLHRNRPAMPRSFAPLGPFDFAQGWLPRRPFPNGRWRSRPAPQAPDPIPCPASGAEDQPASPRRPDNANSGLFRVPC